MSTEEKTKIYSLKIACRDIVEAIKDVKELQKNINRFLNTKNQYIKTEYNYLREEIAKTLDGIYNIRYSHSDDFDTLSTIKLLEENLDKLDVLGNGRIDKLIRDNNIEPRMATSLINDSGYTHEISKKLIGAMTVLLIEDETIKELGED